MEEGVELNGIGRGDYRVSSCWGGAVIRGKKELHETLKYFRSSTNPVGNPPIYLISEQRPGQPMCPIDYVTELDLLADRLYEHARRFAVSESEKHST